MVAIEDNYLIKCWHHEYEIVDLFTVESFDEPDDNGTRRQGTMPTEGVDDRVRTERSVNI